MVEKTIWHFSLYFIIKITSEVEMRIFSNLKYNLNVNVLADSEHYTFLYSLASTQPPWTALNTTTLQKLLVSSSIKLWIAKCIETPGKWCLSVK